MVDGDNPHFIDGLDLHLFGIELAGLKLGERIQTPLSASGEGLGVGLMFQPKCQADNCYLWSGGWFSVIRLQGVGLSSREYPR